MAHAGSNNRRFHGIANGYRSGLEESLAAQLKAAGMPVVFEEDKLKYAVPERQATYTPDFRIDRPDGTHFYVETKGRFTSADRKKHLLVKQSNPDTEIRFVFSRSATKISKTSKTSYADWCAKHGFAYADKRIPSEWLQEKSK